ncbi:MAG: coagulation factor 5/8 type domain protein [Cytophagia bacterium]|nr:MAG: coagulation factor 5/8 type domain protein [Cytophagales bacterium]TAG40599.1 MAG: coagulation factor 5/8 type domain protein [Cytophagia bacterium]TAG83643.1 MAG: coagulation factor 5/8 type domain protein [Cytophagales bacterium]
MKSLLFVAFLLLSLVNYGQQRTYCNPMDIGYRYNFEQQNERVSYRSGADPVIVNHKSEYFLFVTISGGWWHSKDLINWNYITPDKWPMEDMCAPAALSVRDTLYLFQSTFEQRPIFASVQPEQGKLLFYNRWLPRVPGADGPWDPAIFHDPDTDRWFMYWGSSNVFPLYGIELDKSRQLTYKGMAKELFYLYPQKHGWERFGQNHTSTIRPFTEGAWMTKHNGKYYLQYGAPGTEYNVYATGTYVADNPLGPFVYAPYNPVSYKPGGFMNGAGHGNTFQDNFGNYWNTGTPWIAVNWPMERRVAMFPAGFDKDDVMYSNTRFGDFPHYLPNRKLQNKDELFTGWMLLSYQKKATASSTRDTLHANKATDENPRTFWVANQNRNGEILTVDLEKESEVRAVQINYTDYKSNVFNSDSSVKTQFEIYGSLDNQNWQLLADLSQEQKDRPCAYVELAKPVRARWVRYKHVYTKAPNLAISALRVFGNGLGAAPQTPSNLTAQRDKDERNALVKWHKVAGAVGYNVLWGIAKDKLYQTYQVWSDAPNVLELRALSVGQSYYVAIEAFNESGVSQVSEAVFVK